MFIHIDRCIHIFHGDIHEKQVMPPWDVSHGGSLELGATRPGLFGRRVLEGEAGGWGNGGNGLGAIEPARNDLQ